MLSGYILLVISTSLSHQLLVASADMTSRQLPEARVVHRRKLKLETSYVAH